MITRFYGKRKEERRITRNRVNMIFIKYIMYA